MSRRPAAAVNAAPHVVTDYGIDPHGAALFAALTSGAARVMAGARKVIPPAAQWSGYTAVQQVTLAGMAGLGSGAGSPIAQRNSELSKESTALTDPSLRILADRMARGQS